jgi:hypothetical protein
MDLIEKYLGEGESEFRKFLKDKNKEGRKLRIKKNPKFGEWKTVGGKDKDEYILTGKDKSNRSVNIKGSEEFIKGMFEKDAKF